MIKLFCSKKGSGKSKNLINLANIQVSEIKGTAVFIDDDNKRMFNVSPKIRFISMEEYPVDTYKEFSAFICGILSKDYDLENVYIDNLCTIIKEFDLSRLAYYLDDLNKLSLRYNVNVYINVHSRTESVPDELKNYIA
ncbi:MAG: hypothetical protein ACRC41_10460 [Sarcina sp.]